ncbi:hypothetical protein G6L33_15740 [Agrobacterium rhizogenes]|nr:hypothetical protein [Rhizobium rhizogenes]
MTRKALVSSAELKRMAQIAKSEGVTVWIEVDGKRIGVSPNIQDVSGQLPIDPKPEDFTSLAQWQAWRERERAREAQGRP